MTLSLSSQIPDAFVSLENEHSVEFGIGTGPTNIPVTISQVIESPGTLDLSNLRLSSELLMIGAYVSSLTELLADPGKTANKDRTILPFDIQDLDGASSVFHISQGELDKEDLSLGLVVPAQGLRIYSLFEIEQPELHSAGHKAVRANGGFLFSPAIQDPVIFGLDVAYEEFWQSVGLLVSFPVQWERTLVPVNLGASLLGDRSGIRDFSFYLWSLYSRDRNQLGFRMAFDSREKTINKSSQEIQILDSALFILHGTFTLLHLGEKDYLDVQFWSKNEINLPDSRLSINDSAILLGERSLSLGFSLDQSYFGIDYGLSIEPGEDFALEGRYDLENSIKISASLVFDAFTVDSEIIFDDVDDDRLSFTSSSYGMQLRPNPFFLGAGFHSKSEKNYGLVNWYIDYNLELGFDIEAIQWQISIENREAVQSDLFFGGSHFRLLALDPWYYLDIRLELTIDLEV